MLCRDASFGCPRTHGQQHLERSLRISCVLIDADSGTHLWAARYDASLDELSELQDRITSRVANGC